MALALYNNFCYPTSNAAADAVVSGPPLNGSAGIFFLNTYTSGTSATTVFQGRYVTYTGTTTNNIAVSRTFPLCTSLGMQNSMLPITLAESTTLFFSIILCWVIAFGFKNLRRAF